MSVIVIPVLFGLGLFDEAFRPADFGGALAGLEGGGRAASG